MPAKGQAKLTPEQIVKGVECYFSACDASRVDYVTKAGVPMVRQIPYTMIGLANALGISRDCLYEYMNGRYPSDNTEEGDNAQSLVADTITRARNKVEQYTIEHAALGDIDNRIAQLLMSGWGYSAKQEVQHTGDLSVTWQGATAQEAEEYSG